MHLYMRMYAKVNGRRGLSMTVHAVADWEAGSPHDDGCRGSEYPAAFDPRTRRLLEAPITPTLLRLAAPNVLVMVAQASVGLIETYFVGKLGTDALAGVALVFPVVMLMQMMSAGAMGGGISSAIARALGGGRRDDADALVAARARDRARLRARLHGRACSAAAAGSTRAMGGSGASLDAALTYSNVVFAGAVLVWLFNSLANVIRGTGNMAVPAIVTCAGAAVLIPLSPCLIFGWGPFPRLGIAGGAVAVLAFYAARQRCASRPICWSGRSVVRPVARRRRAFAGRCSATSCASALVAALVTVGTNLTIAIATALVGHFGPAAIAGYGTGSRLEYLLVPLVFGLGGPLVAMVGTNIGAGQRERALRAAWIGAAIAAGADRDHRPCCGGVPARLAVAVRREPGHARGRHALPARGRPVLRPLRPRHGALLRVAGRRPPAVAADRQPRAPDHRGVGRLAGPALERQSGRMFLRSQLRWRLSASSTPRRLQAAPGSARCACGPRCGCRARMICACNRRLPRST